MDEWIDRSSFAGDLSTYNFREDARGDCFCRIGTLHKPSDTRVGLLYKRLVMD